MNKLPVSPMKSIKNSISKSISHDQQWAKEADEALARRKAKNTTWDKK